MSLNPSITHSRPLAPHRKRLSSSLTPSHRSRDTTPTPSFGDDTGQGITGGVLGGLRERTESEIQRAGRDDLERALREEWESKDRLAAKVEILETSRDSAERSNRDLKSAMAALQVRVDEAFNEQIRMESDLEERDEMLERFKKRCTDAERQARESQKRYSDQESTFEAERQAHQAQEDHLQKRINTLLSASRKAHSLQAAAPDVASESEILSLREEIASLNLSYSKLSAKLKTLTQETLELKVSNHALQEENEGWEFLVRERTLNGNIREKGLLGGEGRRELDAVSEEYGEEGPDGNMSPAKRQVRNVSGEMANGSSDLAAEIGRAGAGHEGRELGPIEEVDESDALKNELKQLKEANKALTLYCSKIIDRIITQPGFEHILSVDYKTRRASSRNVSGATPLSEITTPLANTPLSEPTGPSVSEPDEPPVQRIPKESKGRPLSMMVSRAFGGSSEKTPTTATTQLPNHPSAPNAVEPSVSESKQEKRARRGFSLDFRSLGFGLSTPWPPVPESKSSLRPLTLSSRATVSTPSSEQDVPLSARKLEPEEEDEEDRRTRHHLEATLKLMGIDKSPSAGDAIVRDGRKSPWSRLYSTFGSTETGTFDSSDPDEAKAALAEFHQQEAERIRVLAEGKSGGGYTTPPRGGVGRRQGASTGMERAVSGGSVRTLWSMGSSRPASLEIGSSK